MTIRIFIIIVILFPFSGDLVMYLMETRKSQALSLQVPGQNHTSSRGHNTCNSKIFCQEAVGHGHHERFVVPQLCLSHES